MEDEDSKIFVAFPTGSVETNGQSDVAAIGFDYGNNPRYKLIL